MTISITEQVLGAMRPELDEAQTMSYARALDLISDFNFTDVAESAEDFLNTNPDLFHVDAEADIVSVLAPLPAMEENDFGGYGERKLPIPAMDFQFNGRLLKLMNRLADDNTPADGLYYAQFAKTAKDEGLGNPPHEEKLLDYLRLYPKVFTITVDPIASQKIYIRPSKGFKRRFGMGVAPMRGMEMKPDKFNKFGKPQRHEGYAAAAHPAESRKLSLYSLSDFAYFENKVEALKKLAEMSAPVDGCFVLDTDEPNPYMLYWNKLERDFADIIRREYNDSEQIFLMSPVGADFPTGFTTPGGVRIFASCVFNKVRNAQSYQPWKFSDFYEDSPEA